jgi:hypothetical protein
MFHINFEIFTKIFYALINHFELIVALIILWAEKWLFLHENLRPQIFMSLKYTVPAKQNFLRLIYIILS